MREEACIILWNMYIVINRISVEMQTVKAPLGGSKGNEKHPIGKFLKGNSFCIVAESFTESSPTIV